MLIDQLIERMRELQKKERKRDKREKRERKGGGEREITLVKFHNFTFA